MNTIGIVISTRNRHAHLNMCVAHFIACMPKNNTRIAVCDDNSEVNIAHSNRQLCQDWCVEYYYHEHRIGVAANKNFGLSIMSDCEMIFLFDDDCFPNESGWELPYINLYHQNIHHLTYTPWMPNQRYKKDNVYVHKWGMGCCMFISQKLIHSIGGFDEKYELFGFEHLSYGRRAYSSGMNGDYGSYLTPCDAIGKIFTLDYDYQIKKQEPLIGSIDFSHIRSVHIDIPKDVVRKNRKLFDLNQDSLFVPLPQYK